MSFIVFVYRPISYFRACHMLKINRLNINTNGNKQDFFVLLKIHFYMINCKINKLIIFTTI